MRVGTTQWGEARTALLGAALLGALLGACSGTPVLISTDEPIRVHEGAFKRGPLPSSQEAADGTLTGPRITTFNNANAIVQSGQAGKTIDGYASAEAYSVGLRLAELGSGYWVVPVGAADPTANGERVWNLTLDLGVELPTGIRPLEIVAIDEEGRAGPITQVRLCIVSGLPGGESACDPEQMSPQAVISLTWDSNVDLDLAVLTSSGGVIDWQHPTSHPEAEDLDDVGVLTRNSNAACVIDGFNREEVVWQKPPPVGTLYMYANLFDACGQLSVNYRMTLYTIDGAGLLVERTRKSGLLDAVAANGGASMGTFVMEVNLQ